MMINTPIRGLRSFCVAATALSFKQAASQLYLTPSAVSHQIKQLEEQLGFDLFVRKTRSLELTHKGEQFFHAVQPQLHQLAATLEKFKQKPNNQTIVIAMPEFFASEIFVPKLSEWISDNPYINIQLETSKPGSGPDRPVDLSIVLSSDKPNNGIADELFAVKYAPACNEYLFEQYHGRELEILNEKPLILHKSRPWSWHQWALKQGIEDFDPQQIIQFDSMFGVVRAAQQGMGIALAPLPMSQSWFEQGLLYPLFDTELVSKDRYFLVQHKSLSKQVELDNFANWIRLNTK